MLDPLGRLADLELAFPVLVRLLREEYPSDYRLARMAYLHGGEVTDEQLAALERIEGGEPYLWPNSASASSIKPSR